MRNFFAIVIVAAIPLTGWADTVYISDTLRVGIRATAENDGAAISVVTTGTQLEVLERSGSYLKVQAPNGVEGWVKSAYVTPQKPAAVLLREANAKIKELELSLKQSQPLSDAPEILPGDRDAAELQAQLAAVQNENSLLQQKVDALAGQLANAAPAHSAGTPFKAKWADNEYVYWVGATIFFLSLGFLFGVSWYKHQVSKRLGGFSL